jgi:hypothetical protein
VREARLFCLSDRRRKRGNLLPLNFWKSFLRKQIGYANKITST